MSVFASNTLAFIFALGVIIFVHELGHYLVAKSFGMRVLVFSLGFGKRLWGFRRAETDYRVSAVPLGGYVKLSGEEAEEATDDPADFHNRPRWQRVLVYLAGPGMNALLAILVIAGLFMVGIDVPFLQNIPPIVGTVESGSAGERAGLLAGDEVLSIAGHEVDRWQEVAFQIMTSPGREIPVVVERAGEEISLHLQPTLVPDYEFGEAGIYPKVLPRLAQVVAGSPAEAAGLAVGDQLRGVDGRALASWADFVDYIEQRPGREVRVEVLRAERTLTLSVVPADVGGKGRIGVFPTFAQRFGPGRALIESVRFNWEIARQSLIVVGKLFRREVAAKSALTGPLGIATQVGAAARTGVKELLYLLAVVSVSIGLLNLFPIPILDGGQIAILAVEGLMRHDLSLKIKERVSLVGLVLLVALMVMVLYFDVVKILPPSWRPGS